MDGYIRYKILPELNLIIEYYGGKINLDDVICHKRLEIKDLEYNGNYHFIADLRDVELNVSIQDITDYLHFVKKNNQVIGQRNSAILTNSPNQVAITTLFKMKGENLPVGYEVFSTLEAAIEWINLSSNYCDIIEEIIRNMKKKSSQPKV